MSSSFGGLWRSLAVFGGSHLVAVIRLFLLEDRPERGEVLFGRALISFPLRRRLLGDFVIENREFQPRRQRRGPEPVAGTAETDAHVRGVEARVQSAHEQPHPRADGVGKAPEAGEADADVPMAEATMAEATVKPEPEEAQPEAAMPQFGEEPLSQFDD